MHEAAYAYIQEHAPLDPGHVVDVGGRFVNGTVRDLFPAALSYICVDPTDGRDVDVQADFLDWYPDGEVGTVVCCEVFEHTPAWRELTRHAHSMLEPGGLFLMTCACPPRAPHSAGTGGVCSADEWYENVDPLACEVLLRDLFEDVSVTVLPETGDLQARGGEAVTIANGYADLTDVKQHLGLTGAADDSALELAITSASRVIDRHCNRRFWLDASTSARYFSAYGFARVDDFSTTTGLVVAVDDSGDRTWSTTWTINTDFYPAPVNREQDGVSGLPYYEIHPTTSNSFPSCSTNPTPVKVTAKWGWAAVPVQVQHACILKAARLFVRRNSPQGIQGGGDFGAMYLSSKEDPDVIGLLADVCWFTGIA